MVLGVRPHPDGGAPSDQAPDPATTGPQTAVAAGVCSHQDEEAAGEDKRRKKGKNGVA